MNTHGITEQQSKLLKLIGELTVGDVPPRYETLAREMGVAKSCIHSMLTRLFQRGHVTWVYGKANTLRLVDPLAGKSSAELLSMRDKIDAALVERMA